jgi:hypothetical protein
LWVPPSGLCGEAISIKTENQDLPGNGYLKEGHDRTGLVSVEDQLNIPHSFLVFPGEGHGLRKNPWHGYIKVREELKWLEKYAGK